jgi:hypothetical protein
MINLAMGRYSALGSLDFSDAGIRIAESEFIKSAKQWQVDDLREYFMTKAYSAMDDLLSQLEENKAIFTAWAGNPAAFTINKKFIVSSAATFQEYHNISGSRRTFQALWPAIKEVEAFTIEEAISPELYARVKSEIASGTISAHIAEILPWLQAATAKYSVAKAVDSNLVNLDADGLTIKSYNAGNSQNSRAKKAPDPLQLQRLSFSASSAGQQWLEKVVSHLNKYASQSKYPEWYTSKLYVAPATDESPSNDKYNESTQSRIFMA